MSEDRILSDILKDSKSKLHMIFKNNNTGNPTIEEQKQHKKFISKWFRPMGCQVCGNKKVPLNIYSIDSLDNDFLCNSCATWLNNIYIEYHQNISTFQRENYARR